MWFCIVAGIFLGTTFVACGKDRSSCPPSEDIYPCFCDDDFDYTTVSCEDSESFEEVQSVLKNTVGHNVSFAFYRSVLGDIPSNFFEGHTSRHLHFQDCKISSFGSKPFSGLEDYLKDLYIHESIDKKRKDLESFPLGHLNKLAYLTFQSNDIKKVGNDWFDGDNPKAIKELNLELNDIEELGDKAFASLLKVKEIWLGGNSFKNVSRSTFPRPAEKLKILELSENGIEELPEDMFADMPALKEINLYGNKLKTIPEATWGAIWPQLKEVYLAGNGGFVCDENIKWIYKQKLPKILTGSCGRSNTTLSRKRLQKIRLEDFE